MAFTQAFISERQTLTELLELYKDCPCLWDTNHSLYGNKGAREKALEVLLDKYKLLVVDANTDTLKKKIEIMRTSYRREHKKVLRNVNHKPSLWYYRLMSFLDGGTTTSVTNQVEDDDDEASGACDSFITELRNRTNPAYKTETNQPRPSKRSKSSSVFLAEHSDPEESTHFKSDELSETDAFGRAVGLQLSGLTPMQKTIAEKLISDVVYYGRLDKLTTNTSLINLNDDYL